MSDTHLANSPEARLPSGELKTNATPATVIEDVPTETPATEAKAPPTPTPPTPSDTTAPAKEGETLLTEKEKPKELTGAPDKYGDFKAPDGYEFRADTLPGAQELFKKLNLSQAGAQELVNFHAAELKAVMEAPQKLWEETRAKWLEEVRGDPEIGGKLDQVKATVARAIDGLGDQKLANEFRKAMDYTGAGNNPAFIRAFYKLAQKVTEGHSVTGGGPSEVRAPNAPPRTAAHALYPNLK